MQHRAIASAGGQIPPLQSIWVEALLLSSLADGLVNALLQKLLSIIGNLHSIAMNGAQSHADIALLACSFVLLRRICAKILQVMVIRLHSFGRNSLGKVTY